MRWQHSKAHEESLPRGVHSRVGTANPWSTPRTPCRASEAGSSAARDRHRGCESSARRRIGSSSSKRRCRRRQRGWHTGAEDWPTGDRRDHRCSAVTTIRFGRRLSARSSASSRSDSSLSGRDGSITAPRARARARPDAEIESRSPTITSAGRPQSAGDGLRSPQR